MSEVLHQAGPPDSESMRRTADVAPLRRARWDTGLGLRRRPSRVISRRGGLLPGSGHVAPLGNAPSRGAPAPPKAGDEKQYSQPIPSKNRPLAITTVLRTWHLCSTPCSFQRSFRRTGAHVPEAETERDSRPPHFRPYATKVAVWIAAGGNTGTGIRPNRRTRVPRRAGCENHKSGSVRAGGGQPPLATRPGVGISKPPRLVQLPNFLKPGTACNRFLIECQGMKNAITISLAVTIAMGIIAPISP